MVNYKKYYEKLGDMVSIGGPDVIICDLMELIKVGAEANWVFDVNYTDYHARLLGEFFKEMEWEKWKWKKNKMDWEVRWDVCEEW